MSGSLTFPAAGGNIATEGFGIALAVALDNLYKYLKGRIRMANNFKNAFATSVSTNSASPTDVYTSNNGSCRQLNSYRT